MLVEQGSEAGADNDGDKGGEFEQAVGAREVGFVHELGEDAVFGGAEEVGLGGEQEEDDEEQVHASGEKGGEAHEHGGDFEGLGDLQDAGFREAVGKLARVAGE